jgi:hypothetical protein
MPDTGDLNTGDLNTGDLNAVIDEQLTAFDKPGVLSVRPGFKMTGDWLTDRRCIVVTVVKKVARPPHGDALPREVGGVAVDVREASPRKRLEVEDPQVYASELRLTPDTGSVPHFPDERTLSGSRPALAASAHAQLASIAKPELPYAGPPGVALDPIEARTTIRLSASPDTGWPTLRDFIAGTDEALTVGLYDFTAKHIASEVTRHLRGKQLSLVLDHPPQNATADQTDADTVAELTTTLGDEFHQAWALAKLDTDATAWIYPTSYHIKVAVRDHTAMWLSSGNWNNSNQPVLDPTKNAADATVARHCDRDWHVVIEQPQLASVLESYIINDLTVAAAHNVPPEQAGPPLTPPPLGSTETKPFHQFFPAKTVTATMRIAPLLTPDPGVYVNAVTALIAAAQHTLYMQFQYIEMPEAVDATSQGFVDLVNAVVARQNAGVDVRIIMSEFETAGYLEQLQAIGLNVVDNVRIQPNVHNKGIIADGASVLVSSQNWSTDGTLYNRDAGVIISDPTAAQYFQDIFLHDWEYLAVAKAQSD